MAPREADVADGSAALVPASMLQHAPTIVPIIPLRTAFIPTTSPASNIQGVSASARAFFAGASPYNGLNLTAGVRFPFYALENRGIRKAPVQVKTADATLEIYWEDGPQLTGWGQPVARYPDGTPAVVQGTFGDGWVVLAGVHPEAPERWRIGLAFTTPAASGHALAATLIDAALNRRPLPRD